MTWRFLKSGPSYQNGPERISTLPSLLTSAAHAPSAQKCGVIWTRVHSPVRSGAGVDCARAKVKGTRRSSAARGFMGKGAPFVARNARGGKAGEEAGRAR